MRRCSALKNCFGSIWRYSYDLYLLSQLHGQSIVPADLRAALIATAKKRGTEKHLADAPAAFDEVETDPNMEKLWRAYQKKFSYAADLSWHTVMESIRSLYRLAQGEEANKSEFEEVVKMKDGKHPNPNTIHPIAGYDKEIYVKPTITNPNIIVGDFTYIADSDFESHVSHLYEWNDDKLIIGKFCQIAAGVEFVMNGANHQMNAVSTFPFYTLEGWEMSPPAKTDLPLKGDTVIENDVWIGQNSVILPGVHIGDGAIIGANSVVGSDVPPYTKVVGNPARAIQKRFDDELIELLLRFKWWDRSIDEINRLIPILTCSDLDKVKAEIKKQLG